MTQGLGPWPVTSTMLPGLKSGMMAASPRSLSGRPPSTNRGSSWKIFQHYSHKGGIMTRLERITWLTGGLIVGAIIVGLWQPGRATAQATQGGVWQLGTSAAFAPAAWRLNTMTGEISYCVAQQSRCIPMGQ
jgi:hypothetical protein